MNSTNMIKAILTGMVLLLWGSAVFAQDELEMRLYDIQEPLYEHMKNALKPLIQEGQSLAIHGPETIAPEGVEAQYDDRRLRILVKDTPQRLDGIEKLFEVSISDVHKAGVIAAESDSEENSEAEPLKIRFFDIFYGMAIQTRNHVLHNLRLLAEEQMPNVNIYFFKNDLIVTAPDSIMDEIAEWIEELQPEIEEVAETEEDRSFSVRRRDPRYASSPSYGVDRTPGRFYESAGYSQSVTSSYNSLGRWARSASSTDFSYYGDRNTRIYRLEHQSADYMIDAIRPMVEFSHGSGSTSFRIGH